MIMNRQWWMKQVTVKHAQRSRRLSGLVKEDISWDIFVETGGATHSIRVQCLDGQSTVIAWGDGETTTATATTLANYSHAYAAGTHTIRIKGGVRSFRHGATVSDHARTVLIRNINTPGLLSAGDSFNSSQNQVCLGFADGCRFSPTVTAIRLCFSNMRALNTIPKTLQIPGAVTDLAYCFYYNFALTYVPLSLWPTGGFTSTGTIAMTGMFTATSIKNSIAPSHILWDSGKTFLVDRYTFYPHNATAWLNHAGPYTDPSTGITYSKIPYAWGGSQTGELSWDVLTPADNTVYTMNYQGSGTIVWGDGTTESLANVTTPTAKAHTYDEAGTYTISIIGPVIYIQAGADTASRAMVRTINTMSLDGYTSLATKYQTTGEFFNCVSATVGENFSFSSSLTNLSFTFNGCSSITTITATIPNTVVKVDGAFGGCSNLTSVIDIPNGITSMSSTFYGCSKMITAPSIPSSVINLSSAFHLCSSLTSAPSLPVGVNNLANAFYYCSKIETINGMFPATLTASSINISSCFAGCIKLAGTAPAALLWGDTSKTWTSTRAFFNCTSLTNYADIPADWKE